MVIPRLAIDHSVYTTRQSFRGTQDRPFGRVGQYLGHDHAVHPLRSTDCADLKASHLVPRCGWFFDDGRAIDGTATGREGGEPDPLRRRPL